MKTSLLILVLVIGGLSAGVTRQREIQSLRRQIAESKDKLTPITDLKQQNTQIQTAKVDTNYLGQLRAERNELMKLRAEISQLRATNQSSPAELGVAIQNVQAEAEKELKRGELIRARKAAKEESKRVRVSLEQLIWVAHELSGSQPDQIAASFEELRSKAEAMPQEAPLRQHFIQILTLARTHPLSATYQKLEFVPRNPGSPSDKRIVLRERDSRPQPDGGWARAYAFSNGDVEEFVLPDGRFDVLEQQLLRPN